MKFVAQINGNQVDIKGCTWGQVCDKVVAGFEPRGNSENKVVELTLTEDELDSYLNLNALADLGDDDFRKAVTLATGVEHKLAEQGIHADGVFNLSSLSFTFSQSHRSENVS